MRRYCVLVGGVRRYCVPGGGVGTDGLPGGGVKREPSWRRECGGDRLQPGDGSGARKIL